MVRTADGWAPIADPAVGAAQAQLVAQLRQAQGWMQQMK
jgi:hypothetical protein